MTEANEWFREMVARHEDDPEYWVEYLKLVFSEEIGRMMDERGVSQAELARRLGTSRAYVAKLLHSTANLTLATMAKLALALDAQVELKLAPRHTSPGKHAAHTRTPRHRRAIQEYVAAEGPLRAGRSDFVASDRPAKTRNRKP
jgi:transcriptional regulator with XRE-family HTH domain